MKNMTTASARNRKNALTSQTTRRAFLQRTALFTGAALGTQYFGALNLLAADASKPLLRVAVIGVGGMGGYSFDCAMRERFVAVSDVDDNKLAGKLKLFSDKIKDQPAPKAYYDYRKMLETQKDIDAVEELTLDNPEQQKSLDQLQKLSGDKLAELQETMRLYDAGDHAAALALVRSGLGLDLMKKIRLATFRLMNEQQRLISLRTSVRDGSLSSRAASRRSTYSVIDMGSAGVTGEG